MTMVRRDLAARMNPSMRDVAQRAGVSIGTVSNVLNHPSKVNPQTARRVREAIAEMGFVRNDAARSLASGSNRSLGLLLADIDNSLFVDMAHGAQDAAGKAGLTLLLANTMCDASLQDQYLDLFDQARVTGLLLAPMEDAHAGVERMRAHGRQIVLLNYTPLDGSCCAVVADNEAVGFLAAQHLISLGCTRLAYLAAMDAYQPVRDRRRGIRAAIAQASATVSLEEIDSGGLTSGHGASAGAALAARAPLHRPDGVITVTDALAQGLITELHARRGIDVPGAVRVVGCEDNRSLGTGQLPLTAVSVAGRQMGREAVRLLLDEVAAGGTHEHETVVLEPTLIVRQSSAGAHRGE